MKRFHEMYGIGRTKYSVFFHDGVKKHGDGSEFYDVQFFKNRVKKDAFVKGLLNDGYASWVRPIYDPFASAEPCWKGGR